VVSGGKIRFEEKVLTINVIMPTAFESGFFALPHSISIMPITMKGEVTSSKANAIFTLVIELLASESCSIGTVITTVMIVTTIMIINAITKKSLILVTSFLLPTGSITFLELSQGQI